MCVCGAWTHVVCIHKASLSIFSGVVVLLNLPLTFARPPGYGPLGTMVQIMPELHSIMDTRQVCEYPLEIGDFTTKNYTRVR